MKLTELEPRFLIIKKPGRLYKYTNKIAKADGVEFLCPKCFTANKGSVGTHHVICWSPKVPATETPGPGRWSLLGTGYNDLTLQASSSSIRLTSGCAWHGFITNGEVTSV